MTAIAISAIVASSAYVLIQGGVLEDREGGLGHGAVVISDVEVQGTTTSRTPPGVQNFQLAFCRGGYN